MTSQLGFFEELAAPAGFRYQDDVLSAEMERSLLDAFASLPFEPFKFHQYTGNRRVVSYGWKYDYTHRKIDRVDDMPDFLFGVRDVAAEFAGVDADRLQQALITEYSPGSAIGWHRDKPEYGEIIGISLMAPCTFRLRRKRGAAWERFNMIAMPRSAYLLSGAARNEWEHSIPAVESLRYSITFRNLRDGATDQRTTAPRSESSSRNTER
jgi:alkylated DNA repair dioxygenase AlkB